MFGFCLFALAFSGVLFYKVSGSYVRVCPRPCLSTCRWARLATHRHNGPPTQRAVRALMPTLAASPPHVCHRRQTGLSPLARTYSRMWPFLWRLHILAHFFPLFGLFNAEVWIQKIGDSLPSDLVVLGVRLNVCFTPRRSLAGTGLTAWVA